MTPPSRGGGGWWLALLLCVAAPAHAADPAAPARESPTMAAERAIRDGRWDDTERELQSLAGRIDVDPVQVLFLTGIAALGQQQYDRAIDAFRRILDRKPDLPRVRLELARALFEKGDDKGARHHFEQVLAAGLPTAVEANVRRFLERIRQRRDWSLEAGVGIVPDSNINTGSNQETVTIAGLPFALSADSREKSGVGVMLTATGTKTVPLSAQWQIRAFASVLRRDYADSRFDDMTDRFGIGPRYLFPRGEVGIAYLHSDRRFGNDGFNRGDGVRVDGVWQFAPRLVLEGTLERQRFDYPSLRGRNGDVLWTFEGLRVLLGPEQSLLLGVDYYNDHAEDPALRNRSTGVTIGHYRDWPHGLTTGITFRTARTEYEGLQPFFGEYRNERFRTWTVSLTKRDWALFDFVPTLSVTQFDNRSTIGLYSFDRMQVLFAFNRRL